MSDVLAMLAERAGSYVDPVALLRPYRVAVTVAEALEYLAGIVGPVRLLGLYEHFFPEEYTASEAAPFPTGSQLYSDKEVEFFNLLKSRYFPLAYWFEDLDNDEMEEREELIPVWPETTNLEDEWLINFRPGWQLLFILSGVMRSGELGGVDDELAEVLERAAAVPELDPALFQHIRRTFEGASGHLRHVPMALRMIDHSTDCVWLDAYTDSAYGPTIVQPWCIEGIEWLRDEYEKCEEITADVDGLLAWIEAGHENRLHLVELWESAVRSEEATVLDEAEQRLLAEDEEREEEDGTEN